MRTITNLIEKFNGNNNLSADFYVFENWELCNGVNLDESLCIERYIDYIVENDVLYFLHKEFIDFIIKQLARNGELNIPKADWIFYNRAKGKSVAHYMLNDKGHHYYLFSDDVAVMVYNDHDKWHYEIGICNIENKSFEVL